MPLWLGWLFTLGVPAHNVEEVLILPAPTRWDRPRVVVISRSMATKFWPNEDAIRKHVALSFFESGPREAVGIVDNVKINGLNAQADAPTLYDPTWIRRRGSSEIFRPPFLTLAARTAVRPESLARSVENAVRTWTGRRP